MDALYWLLLASRVLHILGAIILVGGIFYLRAVVAPAVPEGNASADTWFAGRRAAWAKWVGIATALLIFTGVFNYYRILKDDEPMGSTYELVFGTKFVLAFVLFTLTAILAGRSAAAERCRRNMKAWLSASLAIGLAIILLAGVLRSLHGQVTMNTGPPLLIQPSTGQPPE